ncbi:Crp/Fnr family transcriptional regulator [Maricurvus nonylphenolicus]|uniref:Crp/Fnr family transcriptional regulator n=1 Tax=Maricurvus nonylphenolicus TaxID=1008307 RepID=UPI0036F40F53
MPSEKNSPRIMDAILNCPWFTGIDTADLEVLAGHASVKRYKANEFIYQPGERKTHIFCILEGRIRRSISSSLGQELSLSDQLAGEWIPDAIATERPLHLDMKAIEATDMLAIPRGQMISFADNHPSIYKHLYLFQAETSRGLLTMLEAIAHFPLRARLAARIVHLANDHGNSVEGGTRIPQCLSQNDLALLSFGSRPRVNRILKEWTDRGILTVDNKHYIVNDIEALAHESEQHYL